MAVPRIDTGRGLGGPGTSPSTAQERWRKVEILFNAASELGAEDRPAFLAAACGGDAGLREEVESLLDSADKTLGVLHKPVQEAAQAVAALGERRLGNYQLIKPIGEGGMGDVYLAARADDQFQRQVAIKLMRAGYERNPDLLPRFRAERQILANLDHPNIARLLDGGVTAEGQPYLVMELVEGVPIDEYCRRLGLSTAQRLKLFSSVCGAVEYAHRNLVIHRDIKPANILVTAEGIPKLLDFGIAKLVDPERADLESTRATQRLMTPEYASPEQILGNPVTTAADIFQLGVLLYELLVGQRPFRLRTENLMELPREICERNPPAPSAAAKPGAVAPREIRRWANELDGIVLKAMSKEPGARYGSAAQFAADLEAYVSGRAVSTRAGDWRYVAGKFVARHKGGVAVTAAAILLVVGSSAGLGVLAHRATEERLKAEREAKFLVDMFKAATPEVARGQTVTARNLLDAGAQRVDRELGAAPAVRASLLHSIAEAYESLGLYSEARAQAERAYRLKLATLGANDASTADSLFLLANLTRQQGEYEKAEPLFAQVVAIRKRTSGEKDDEYAQALSALGECLYLQTKDADAEPLLRKALAIYRANGNGAGNDARNYLALLLERKGGYAEAGDLLREAVEIDRRTQGVDSPDYAVSLHNLASALIDAGDLSGAETKLREVLAIRRKVLGNGHPMLVYTLNNLGYVLLEKGNWRAAEPLLRESLELNRRSMGEKSPRMTACLNNWARLLQAKGDLAGARTYYQRALETQRQGTEFTSWTASQVLLNMGLLEFDGGKYVAAETLARQSVEMRRRLGGEKTPGMAAALIDLGEDQLFEGYARSAEPLLQQALEIRRKTFGPKHPDVVAAETRLGEAMIAAGEAAQAEPILREAVDAARSAPFPLLNWQVAQAESALAADLGALGKTQEAEALARGSEAGLQMHPRAAFRVPASVRLEEIRRRTAGNR